MTRALGARFEALAATYLVEHGWTILSRNFRDGPREIDLVARRSGIIAFIEVKARTSVLHGHPLEAIGFVKRRDLERAAKRWIRESSAKAAGFRFDALAITKENGSWHILHVPDAWRLGE